jgi:lysophospholipase L1-like esterase
VSIKPALVVQASVIAAAMVVFSLSIACAQPSSHQVVVALGDSITYGWDLPDRQAQVYVAKYARHIGGKLVNLATPGVACSDIAHDQVPKMPPHASIVILNCGTNDIGGFKLPGGLPNGHERTAPATQTELRAGWKSYQSILSTIHRQEPQARVILLTVRDWQRMTGPPDPRFSADVNAWNTMIRSSTHASVVDIEKDSRMYQPKYIQEDLIHPNAAGNEAIAEDILAAIR